MTRLAVGTMALLLLGLALPAGDAGAAEIKVLSTGNMANILADITGPFERATGHKLVIETGSVTAIRNRVKSGEAADLTINERPELEDLLKEGRIAAGSIVDIARSPFGVAVRAGAPKPDISTVDAFKRAFLTADSIAVPNPSGGAQDGVYFMALIERLGMAEQLKPKIKLTQGGDNAAKAVATGEAQIGIAQRRNFFKLNTVQNLEPLPDIPGIKFLMAGGVPASAREPAAARELARFLSSATTAPIIVGNGMEAYVQ
jgi:molybdate transport system substrate-binding protein